MPPFKILICEDSADKREYLRLLLGGCDDFHLVGAFVTGEDAVAAVHELAPDVIIMDIELPGISGIESTRLIKEILPHTHIIMYTVYEDDEKLFDSLCAGASGYLLKKTPPDQLAKAIKDVMEGGSPMSPGIAQKVMQYFHKLPKKMDYHLCERELNILRQLVDGLPIKI
ncbi:MAG: response regulator transcription factor, partial [Saprospiraceae bacterium]|nr:response regulator transcription factor [Saprospiraceae bacterium]